LNGTMSHIRSHFHLALGITTWKRISAVSSLDLETLLKITLLSISIAYTGWKFCRDVRHDKKQ